MEQQWKKSLYVYVDQLNKGRVAPGAEPRHTSIRDPRFLDEQRARSRRIAQWYSRRGITPLRGRRGCGRCGPCGRILPRWSPMWRCTAPSIMRRAG